jgi:hypothetical protein
MEKIKFQKLLFKYSIILSFVYLINSSWFYLLPLFIESFSKSEKEISLFYYFTTYFRYFLYLIVAIIVYYDLQKHHIKNFWIVLLTFLFGFFGVGLFFIHLFYKFHIEKTDSSEKFSNHGEF